MSKKTTKPAKKVAPKKAPAKKPASKPAKKPQASFSVSSLQAELSSLTAQQDRLESRKAEITAAVKALEVLGGKARKAGRPAKTTSIKINAGEVARPLRNGKPTLEVVFRKVLTKSPKGVTLANAVKQIEKSGYKTKSDDLAPALAQLIFKMRGNGTVESVASGERAKLYRFAA